MESEARRILVIDDSEDIALSFKIGLKIYGYQIDSATDPVMAVRQFSPGRYDLILLDIKMPKMDGFQVARELRKTDKTVKICFLTAFEILDGEFKELFPELSVQGFVNKPIAIKELAQKITTILAQPPRRA
jgi:two-component system catabolic regulation response regulator CreB/two-component system response regulator ChvI